MVGLIFRGQLLWVLSYAFQSNWHPVFRTHYYRLFFIYVSTISLSGFLYLRYYDLFSEWQRTNI